MSQLTYQHAYVRYLESLPRAAKCACGSAPIGRCPVCSIPSHQENLPIEHTEQLRFAFMLPSHPSTQE
jgi:hypothetical protein